MTMKELLKTSHCGRTDFKSGRRMNRIKDILISWVVSKSHFLHSICTLIYFLDSSLLLNKIFI